ncbi:MAG: hypothetical protein NC118_03470 [Eubacterium sp.]|nr:hypothetical protein [Eubacterium sp.]
MDNINFTYYERVNKLYIWREKAERVYWKELEDYKDYLLYDIIIGSYLDNGRSRFSIDNLGEFEIIDCLMPYEYCGIPDRKAEKTEVDEQGVSYITWIDTGSMLCVQQKIEQEVWYDDQRMLHMVLTHIPLTITDEIFRRDTGATRFVVQIEGKECELSDLIDINDDFIGWMKYSGQVEGNLQKISPDRETGCKETQQMLQNFPEEKMQIALEHCEFYIDPGYLHVRLPYWDYKLKEPAFVRNGNDLWRGWLTMRTDDIERFLRVEKW